MAKSTESDVWDEGPLNNVCMGPTFVRQVKAKVVRDDWDEDDEDDDEVQEGDVEEEEEDHGNVRAKGGTKSDGATSGLNPRPGKVENDVEEDSSRIWEEANKKAPMPELILAPSTTNQGFVPPPPAALQPMLRILKRPSANIGTNNAGVSSVPLSSSSPGPISGSNFGATSPAPRGTLAEREAQYQEARDRIFGEKQRSGVISRTCSISGGVSIVRDPLGPASETEPDNEMHGPGRPAKGFGERRRGRK